MSATTDLPDLPGLLAGGKWRAMSRRQKEHLLQRIEAADAAARRAAWVPYPWQRPHAHPDGWGSRYCTDECAAFPTLEFDAHDMFLVMGGRGIGKTDVGSQYVLDHVNGPPCDPRSPGGHRVAIVAPTIGDAVGSCINGPSGLHAYDPRVVAVSGHEGTQARFPNGARAKVFGAHTPEDVNRLRSGGNRCLVWLEEAAAQRHLAQVLEHTALGLRVGSHPHYVVTTTPRARPEVKAWLNDPAVYITRGRTDDAHHLDAAVRHALRRKYAGTTTGLQELDGLILEDVAGALWRRWMIDDHRVLVAPPLVRIVVAVDPNAGGPDECGIVVVGLAVDRTPTKTGYLERHVFVLEDASGRFDHPGQWAARVVQAVNRWGADTVVAEVNNGGDMVPHTIRTVDSRVGGMCRSVTATRGKVRRAEPIVSLYEQERVHHVGAFPQLEDQMTGWVDGESSYSPDRMDALVWACTALTATGDGLMVAVV